jgi:SAM-dependent methyltransferase
LCVSASGAFDGGVWEENRAEMIRVETSVRETTAEPRSPRPGPRQEYLPEDATSSRVRDALHHTRNKNIVVEPRRLSLRDRLVRALWWRSTRLRDARLAAGSLSVIVSEQVIENASVLRHVDPSVRKVLDFGAFESTLPLALAGLGIEVTVVDQRRYPFSAERLEVLQHDILEPLTGLRSDFDLVYSISTIEHVGLAHYGDPPAPDGDRLALANLWDKVRPGGRLIFSVPAGRPGVQRGYRVYDEAGLRRIMPSDGEISFYSKRGRSGVWGPSRAGEIADHVYENYMGQAPAEGVAVVIIGKQPGPGLSS